VNPYWVYLPFEAGASVRVSQGNHGSFSHSGSSKYALDFPVPEGTPIHAVSGGRVVRLKKDSDEGCGEPECANLANYIHLDHGDGIISRYVHLQLEGVLVDVGDEVERGQKIGLSGNTGYSTGPHLHMALTDMMRESVPIRFEDLRESSNGAAFSGPDLVSINVQVPNDSSPDYSDCPSDLFNWMGVTLAPGFPCVLAYTDTDYTLAGYQHGDAGRVVFGKWNGTWEYGCEQTDSDGYFEVPYRWDSDVSGAFSYLIVGAAREDCSFGQGWGKSPSVNLASR
jgi:hypothetical protein